MTASHVGNASAGLQLFLNAFQRGNPGTDEVGGVVGPEESFGTLKKPRVVLVPSHAGAGPESLLDKGFVLENRHHQLEGARQIGRAILDGKGERLFVRQRVALSRGVIGNVSA